MRKFLAIASGCLVVGLSGGGDGGRQRTNLLQGRPPDSPEQLPDAAIGPAKSRRCRSSPTSRRGRGRGRSRRRPSDEADAAVVCGSRLRHFANERKLTATRDRRRSPRGPTPARRPATRRTRRAARTSRDGWNIKPDVIVEMPKPFEIPATGTINYKYIVVKTNFKEDMWVVAAEMRPGNPAVLHHGKVWVRPPGSSWMKDARAGRGVRERDAARHHRPQLDRGRQRHPRQVQSRASARSDSIRKARRSSCRRDRTSCTRCTTRRPARPTSDVSKLGLVLAKEAPEEALLLPRRPDGEQPGDSAGRRQCRSGQRSHARRADATLVYAQPHMHLRGKDFELRVISAGRRNEDGAQGQLRTSNGRWAISTPSRSRCPRARSSGSSRTSTTRRRTASIRIRRRRSSGVPRTGTR